MLMSKIINAIKLYGIRGCIVKLLNRFKKNRIKEFNRIKNCFQNMHGLEIGGPSSAFTDNGYIPVYKIAGTLDGVNFSDFTVWTGNIEGAKGFVVNGKTVGKMYIADATDLSQIKNGSYDFILSSNNIEHIANPMKAMEQWVLKLKSNGVLAIIAPRKEANFDHKREITKFSHILKDYNDKVDERDLTHLEEILALHDLSMDLQAGTLERFKERSLKNYENRCLHHHVFDLNVLNQMCDYFNMITILTEEKYDDYIVIAKKK